MKILLFGRNGQVGWELQRSLAPLGELVALASTSTDYSGDLADAEGLRATIAAVKPQVIVNAAAYTAVDRAEAEPDRALAVNGTAPGVMAQAAKAVGALLVHYSTDYVFDGTGTHRWKETDPTAPLGVYGATKLEGERRIEAAQGRHLIFRTSWVYAARGGNFAKTMLRLAKEREALTVVDDQFGAPTGAELLADATAHAIRAALADPKLCGLYHLAAAGETSWYGYARMVLASAQAKGVELRAGPDAVQPVPSSQFKTAARRPNNSRLDTTRFEEAFGLAPPPWQQGVERMLTEVLT
ncbi:dTDP-4-dehydrorhamnose reductase [Ramlibacter albus]|uniref:dTDP-4-dehydrorhamnose reductase n=1 Tax=Ramlibacter albus TaxID=2079448 RepID=A0A923M6J9_9BURK|nr:dTDP-4-dehydrorhamnose reductase [Ramlibacter albus]MBC5764763.1 dTDP-4-dehydrorhamnose reductase [Ramlibacter albus]